MSGVYGKFFNLVKALTEATPEWPKLDAVEERFLYTLSGEWYTGNQVTVLDAASIMEGVSESTAHRRLATLVKKGVIKFTSCKTDRRIKIVLPTDLTIYYFSQLSACLKNAAE